MSLPGGFDLGSSLGKIGDAFDWATEPIQQIAQGQNPITDPGGLIGSQGQIQNPLVGNELGALIDVLNQCNGAPYRFFADGGDGWHNNSVSDVLATGESCTGIFVFAFRQIGLTPPFTGVPDATSTLQANGAEPFDANKEYPIGTFLISRGGPEGHMAMVVGAGNVIAQELHATLPGWYGLTMNHTIAETQALGSEDLQFELAGQFTSELGSATTLGSAGSAVSDAASGAVSGLGSLGDTLSHAADWIAQGLVDGFLRILRAIYGYVILRPFDFAGGYWWELTRRFLGYLEQHGVGKWKLPGADATEDQTAGTEKQPGQAFSDEDKKRIYFILFVMVTYYIGFGRDQDGMHYFDKLAGGAGDLFNRDLWGKRTYNNRATAKVRVHGVTVARRRSKATTRRVAPDATGRDRAVAHAQDIGTPQRSEHVGGKSKRRATGKRDARGRFVKRAADSGRNGQGQKAKAGTETGQQEPAQSAGVKATEAERRTKPPNQS